jgi:hypothetical protein
LWSHTDLSGFRRWCSPRPAAIIVESREIGVSWSVSHGWLIAPKSERTHAAQHSHDQAGREESEREQDGHT